MVRDASYGVLKSLRKVENAVNPLLGGVPAGRGGLVSSATINSPLLLPGGD
jgi:hypothetical protein